MWITGIPEEAVHAFVDQFGFRALVIDGSVPPLLTEAFEDDVQTLRDMEVLYEEIERVTNGFDQESVFSGNTSTVTVHPDSVTIVSDVRDGIETVEMTLAQYLVLLDVWAKSLRGSSE